MTSLLDIGDLSEEVSVSASKKLKVYGVTPEGLFFLLRKFPDLQRLTEGEGVNMQRMQEVAPESIAYAIALAISSRGYQTQKDWLEIVEVTAQLALGLPAQAQLNLFQAALRLTFPEGIGPFMMGVEALTENINRVSGVTVSGTTSSKSSRSGFVTDLTGMRLGPRRPRASSQH